MAHLGFVVKMHSNYKHAAAAIVLAGIAFLFQKPERVNACDAESGIIYKLTHSYWHILISAASFFHHRFCFFEKVEGAQRQRNTGSFQMSRLRKGSSGVGGVTFEERNSLIVENGTVSIKGVEVLL
jgi:hypothetical protein